MSWPVTAQTRADIDRLITELNHSSQRPLYGTGVDQLFRRVVAALKGDARIVLNDDILHQPVATLLEVLKDALEAAAAYEATLGGTATVSGPVLFHSTVTTLNNDGEFGLDYVLLQSYFARPGDPVGATKVQVQMGVRPVAGDVVWREDIQANWFLIIDAAAVTIDDSITPVAQTDRVSLRFRFVDNANAPLSEWSYSGELTQS
jgi:hypothetical protein